MIPGGGGEPTVIYSPFSTSDLYNWKLQTPSFSEKPQGLTSLLESIFFTHQPTWDDCQQLLQVLFTTEEKERILREAARGVTDPNGQPTADLTRLQAVFPTQRPQWDPNTDQGKEALLRYRQFLLQGLRAAARRPINLSKVSEVIQTKDESPAAFLERLLESYRLYTPIDPEDPNNRRAINLAFVSQSAPDIRKKLQRLEGFEGENLSKLLEIAQKVFNNRDGVQKVMFVGQQGNRPPWKKKKKNPNHRGGPSNEEGQNRKPRLGRDQCAICKKKGHWKNECPEKEQPGGEKKKGPSFFWKMNRGVRALI